MEKNNRHTAVAQLEKISTDYAQWEQVYQLLVDTYYDLLRDGDYTRTAQTNLDAEAKAHYRLGKERWDQGNLQGAAEQLTGIHTQAKEFQQAQSDLSQIYVALGHQARRDRRWNHTIEWWNRALQASPGLLNTLRWRIFEAKARAWIKYNEAIIIIVLAIVGIGVAVQPLSRCLGWKATAKPTPTLILTPMPSGIPTVSPTPTQTPEPTSTPSQTSTPTGTPTPTPTEKVASDLTVTGEADCDYDVELVRVRNQHNFIYWYPNSKPAFTLTLRNTGACDWPEETELILVSERILDWPDSWPIGSVAKAQSKEIEIQLQAPSTPQTLAIAWQLQGQDTQPIGQEITHTLIIQNPTAAPESTTSSLTTQPPPVGIPKPPSTATPDLSEPTATPDLSEPNDESNLMTRLFIYIIRGNNWK